MTNSADATATLQTPPGRGGLAVIQLSGRGASHIIEQVFKPNSAHQRDSENDLRLGHLTDGDATVDEAVVTRRGHTYEISIHGGPATARASLELLVRCGATVEPSQSAASGFSPTHPKWDNAAIGLEMLETLPKTRSQLCVAAVSRQWSAGLSELVSTKPGADRLRKAASELSRMERLLDPAEVVLAGEPNVGKSTLANALIGRQVSIVHDVAGTTRDWVREPAVLDGVPVHLTDTAGLWKGPHEIDAEAVRRSRGCIERADLVVFLHVGPASIPGWLAGAKLLPVASKCDLAETASCDGSEVAVSALSGAGIAELKGAIKRRLGLDGFDSQDAMAFTARQAKLLEIAAARLDAGEDRQASQTLEQLLRGC